MRQMILYANFNNLNLKRLCMQNYLADIKVSVNYDLKKKSWMIKSFELK